MDRIDLKNTLPEVFASLNEVRSDVWHRDISFEKGDIYLIEANSGTGKSSLCSYLAGYRRDYQGIICFDGQNIAQLKVHDWVEIRKKHLSLLFQELRLFPELTAYENVAIKNDLTGWKKKKEILAWFERLGIADKIDQKIRRMSFGQQQRVAFIRSLCQPFDFLFLDEPNSHLDEKNAQIMAELITNETKQQGAGLIVTSTGNHLKLPYTKTYQL